MNMGMETEQAAGPESKAVKIAVASGKGGTGKTMIAVSLVKMLGPGCGLADLDVEEPNAGLYFKDPNTCRREAVRMVPVVDYERCTMCGICSGICAFNALVAMVDEIAIFPELCHSCAACFYRCPEDAISEGQHHMGIIEEKPLKDGAALISGKLAIGEAQSPPLIKAVKKLTDRRGFRHVVLDCPPGTGCGTLEAIEGADYCLLVTEPTPFGHHDLSLALEAISLLQVPASIIVNRWREDDAEIGLLAEQYKVPIIARIPFSRSLATAFAEGRHPLRAMPELRCTLAGILEELQVGTTCKK